MHWERLRTTFYAFTMVGLLTSTLALANTYEVTTQSNDYETLMRAKNCFDYITCAPSETKFSFDQTVGFLSHTTITLSPPEFNYALTTCGIVPNKNEIKVKDLTLHANLFFTIPTTFNRLNSLIPVIYMKKLPQPQLEQLIHQLAQHIKSKQKEKAIALIIETFELPTSGYQVIPAKTIDAGYSVTDHQKKTIQIGDDFFEEPFDLIRGIRHELEHAFQSTHASSCKKNTGYTHNLSDHTAREHAAHFNDLANLSKYCTNPVEKKKIQKSVLKRLLEHYRVGSGGI